MEDLEWYRMDMEIIAEGERVSEVDLSSVDEIGFTDLMPGGRSIACSRLDWLAVYGYLVPRNKEE